MAETAYCVKCRANVNIKDTREVKMRNGRSTLKGNCVKCGTTTHKILPTKKTVEFR